jgi:hypothetical protein
MRIRGIRNLFDPGSGINIPDPQHCAAGRELNTVGSWDAKSATEGKPARAGTLATQGHKQQQFHTKNNNSRFDSNRDNRDKGNITDITAEGTPVTEECQQH